MWLLGFAAVGSAGQEVAEIPLRPAHYVLGAGYRWERVGDTGAVTNGHYFAPPAEDQGWDEWYKALMSERASFRESANDLADVMLTLRFDGVRAWIRGGMQWVGPADLSPGDPVRWEMDARWVEGADELCLAFDFVGREGADTGIWQGWSEVVATATVPNDGEWHSVAVEGRVPEFDAAELMARPILGMDGTYRADPAVVQIRDLRCRVPATDALSRWLADASSAPGYDDGVYERADLRWMSRNYACGFLFIYDRRLWDPEAGEYRVDTLLDEAESEFGGYDSVVLWQAYPRIGADPRNQFDFFRDMPGGLDGVSQVVDRFHERGVRVFIPYNPWDTGTRREDVSDSQALADVIEALGADGIFLDTMLESPPGLRAAVDAARPGVAFEPEIHPEATELQHCNGSWAQWLQEYPGIGVLRLKWLEPRHMQHQIHRWDERHTGELKAAWLNGSGMLVWENIFGSPNPWHPEDRALLRRAVPIARRFAGHLTEGQWRPLIERTHPDVQASEWELGGIRLWTLVNLGDDPLSEPILGVEPRGDRFFDLWTGTELTPQREGNLAVLSLDVEHLGAVLAVPRDAVTGELLGFLRERSEATRVPVPRAEDDPWMDLPSVLEPAAPPTVPAWSAGRAEGRGLLPVDAADRTFRIEHQRRECGCYPDPDVPPSRWGEYTTGTPWNGSLLHRFEAQVAPHWTMPRCVTNGEFQEFLDATGYEPDAQHRFLDHWGGDRCPEAILDEPVVYVDLADARAYAEWARMRLPTELEWHHAAQSLGEDFRYGRVWEWTESERDDGWNRYVLLRGGSEYQAQGSGWYFPGGEQPIETHAKFLLMWPGLDRCSTIGFRCVAPRRE